MKLSIILPTYNNENTLDECLSSLTNQTLSKKDYEILIIDGGSTDSTIQIAKKYKTKIINNPKRAEEPARIMGVHLAKGEILAFIDADNVVEGRDWLERMIEPFKDKKIQFADTLYFTLRKSDKMKVRYQALIGGDDPLATYLGLYSRWCYFKNDWTDFPYESEDKGNYLKVKLQDSELVPAMGSNGFLIRKRVLLKIMNNSFIHTDILYDLINGGYNCFAKVKTGIVHNQPTFFKNKIRRILRRQKNQVNIRYNYGITGTKIALSFLRIIFIFPLIVDVILGFIKKPDTAWIFHFPASIGLVFIHLFYRVQNILKFK